MASQFRPLVGYLFISLILHQMCHVPKRGSFLIISAFRIQVFFNLWFYLHAESVAYYDKSNFIKVKFTLHLNIGLPSYNQPPPPPPPPPPLDPPLVRNLRLLGLLYTYDVSIVKHILVMNVLQLFNIQTI